MMNYYLMLLGVEAGPSEVRKTWKDCPRFDAACADHLQQALLKYKVVLYEDIATRILGIEIGESIPAHMTTNHAEILEVVRDRRSEIQELFCLESLEKLVSVGSNGRSTRTNGGYGPAGWSLSTSDAGVEDVRQGVRMSGGAFKAGVAKLQQAGELTAEQERLATSSLNKAAETIGLRPVAKKPKEIE